MAMFPARTLASASLPPRSTPLCATTRLPTATAQPITNMDPQWDPTGGRLELPPTLRPVLGPISKPRASKAFSLVESSFRRAFCATEAIGQRITFRALRSDPRFAEVLRRINLDPAKALGSP